jgi:uncharacterized membrane protein
MTTCPKCGAQTADDAKFCPACGTTITAGTGPATSPTSAPVTPATPPSSSASGGGMSPGVAALLVYIPVCFIGIVCAILFGFVVEPYRSNRFIRFHALQSLALHVCWIGLWIASWVMVMVMAAVIHFFAVLVIPVYFLLLIGWLGVGVFMMIKANGMQTYKLPLIGDWAEKQANG